MTVSLSLSIHRCSQLETSLTRGDKIYLSRSLGCCNLGEQSPSAFLVLKISLAQHNNSKELPKKPHEGGPPEQMPTDALS